ncbi:MAG TPA: thioredoxin family protein [Thermoanaerobaculia bacterium]|nr:thioredoxin family protein [Thermoanaerobaculia bacterium]
MILAAQAAAGTAMAMGAALAVGAAGEALVAARRRRRWRGGSVGLAMNPLPREVWSRHLTYAAYLATVSRNRETFDEVYRQPSHRESDLAWLRRLPALRVLAIAEDWCPDVYQTLPTWARLVAELPGWELGVFARDANPELMECFLWQGDRARIPVYAFYLGDRLQAWWSGRGAAAEQALAALLSGRSFADLPEPERRRATLMLAEGYRAEYRRQNLEEVLALLHAFFHVAA